jgi:hypothetical protein
MGSSEVTRGIYQYIENDGAGAIEPHDPTQETKSAATEDGKRVPIAAGEIKRIEGYGQKLEALLAHALEQLHEARPTDIWGGTGASSETGIAIARRETALLTKLTPYQTNIAEVCKRIHMDGVDRYVARTGAIKLAYLPPEATSASKPEVREITRESAVLPMDMDYMIGSDTPESKAAREQMSSQAPCARRLRHLRPPRGDRHQDPNAAEMRLARDRLMAIYLGPTGRSGIIDDVFRSRLRRSIRGGSSSGTRPPPKPPPQILGPNGEPLPPSGAGQNAAQATSLARPHNHRARRCRRSRRPTALP